MAFRVGQKVVCVDNRGTGQETLELRAIYTVTMLCPAGPNGVEGIRIAEVASRHEANPNSNLGWMVTRFRPVVERKTDISVFEAMLTGTRQPVSLGEEVKP